MGSTQQLLVKDRNLRLARMLMSTDHVNVLPYVPLRIDIKGEEKYLFDWHQDFPYTPGSEDGIVVWAPLFDVLNHEGGIKFIPGSHHDGVVPVIIADKQNTKENGAHTVRIPNAEVLEDEQAFTIDVYATDVLVFSTLLLHKSMMLRNQPIRWTTQLRYANFNNPSAVMKGWLGGMIEGCWFENVYSEYVVQDNKDTL
ncbi:phytanoyl-CoA dioxygenase family protein [Aliidiomarina celeris]|uniref:phytanoyl-CoA dioxygenase family protein n=1 Tax=Aliidiomarina celeris TaxID=2249428 RepID=UPI000DEB8223|nr:phytanoyl-CoA dioxygenase family protein [Aliidiomarina celeris]